jgi:exonuclease VII small subunit
MAKKESKPIDELTYEEAFFELGTIVEALESAEHPLEESVTSLARQALAGHVQNCWTSWIEECRCWLVIHQ